MKALIQKLVETDGPSGYETNLRSLVRSQVEPFADQVWVDNLGNLFARKGQAEANGLKIMLADHMDEIGLMVPHIMRLLVGPDHRRLGAKGQTRQHAPRVHQ